VLSTHDHGVANRVGREGFIYDPVDRKQFG
jgi:hypothetical protein